jgi:ADP-heptose:LPS heptosyltransferase
MRAPPLVSLIAPSFNPDPREVKEVADLLRTITGRREVPPLILLNANASDLLPLRRWDSDRYVSLARRLLDTYPEVHVAFTGGPGEGPAVEALVRQVGSDRCVSLAGRTTMRQLLIVYTLARVLVTNDSGPAHFASLTPISTVTLFGPETPELFAAPSPRSHVIWAQTVCSPCVSAYNIRLYWCSSF